MQSKEGAGMLKSFSFEELLVFVKKTDTTAAETEVIRERRQSAASSSHSFEVQCHVSQFLLLKSYYQ